MPRRYYRRYRRTKRKYSVEQRALQFNLAASTTTAVVVVPSTVTQGMRKVKNFTVNLVSVSDTTVPIYWALVYVPQGTQAGSLNITNVGISLYEPNQFVITCGISDPTAGPIRFYSPLSRNLNSGDAIYLLVANQSTDVPSVCGTVRYAISY